MSHFKRTKRTRYVFEEFLIENVFQKTMRLAHQPVGIRMKYIFIIFVRLTKRSETLIISVHLNGE